MDLGLAGQVILVSGGARGIGAAIAAALAAEGARAVVVDRDADAVHQLTGQIDGMVPVIADLRTADACRDAVATALQRTGQIDGVVNNAGVNDSVGLEHGDPARYRESLRTNLHHYYDIAHYALPHLIAARGAILNIASKTAVTGQGNTSGYASAKGAILALTREWAAELLPHGIRVNAIIPAEVATPQYTQWLASFADPGAKRAAILARIPLDHRMTLPEEIAATACFLLSARATHITGQHVYVDGGYVHLDRALT
ncbi:MAG: SDR family oxidoreductase [Gemmatimonadales bacterium]